MKRLFTILLIVFGSGMLVACDNVSIEFTTDIPDEIMVGDTFMIDVNDSDMNAFDQTDIEITVKTGSDLIVIDGFTAEAVAAGDVVLTITVTRDGKTASKDLSFTITEPEIIYGIPDPELGYYMRDADVIESEGVRYLAYATNSESGEEDNVIAIRKGLFDVENGYHYQSETIAIQPSLDGWDRLIGAPSIVRGDFSYDGIDYTYMMAYQGTESMSETSFNIGLAVTNDPEGDWVKVGSAPVLTYDAEVYGESYAGFYAPSLVNLDRASIVRLFFTWADAYGHFTYFVDLDASDLDVIDLSGYAMVPNAGNLSSGEDVTMIPNADFAYDALATMFYAVKDYSPTASRAPLVATRIELARIAEDELYTALPGIGWRSLRLYDMFDTPDTLYERLYSGTLVTDFHGHVIDPTRIEIIYNVSELEADNVDHVFSQKLMTFIYEA